MEIPVAQPEPICHNLKPPDGSPMSTPVQPNKKSKCSTSEGFAGERAMEYAVVTANDTLYQNEEADMSLDSAGAAS
ncbi:unnamed protein product [Linum trigynum]|uniref:Uncharacterized protein n=1 Tax=Linum trigynum TaxID=586398 RepID=A0AAV2FAB5_9ROSI